MRIYNLVFDWGRITKGVSQNIYPSDLIQEAAAALGPNTVFHCWIVGCIDARNPTNNLTMSNIQGMYGNYLLSLTCKHVGSKFNSSGGISEKGADVAMYDMVVTNTLFVQVPSIFYIGDGDLTAVMAACLTQSGQQPMLLTHNVVHPTLIVSGDLLKFEQLPIIIPEKLLRARAEDKANKAAAAKTQKR